VTAQDLAWLAAPVAALAVACLALVPLGAQVLARGVVFIDLAVAQIAACGALASSVLLEHPAAWSTALAAAIAALAGAALVRRVAAGPPGQREARIGLLYVAGASVAVLGAAWSPHGREQLAALLAADVLWAPWSSTGWLAAAALLVLLAQARLARDAWFYPVFALALSAAVPVLGLYLVFALLIAPALWLARGLRLAPAVGLAGLACALGLALSWALDWPSGACVALVLCGFGLGASTRPKRTA
jgi:zinc/manganese transport system permease protein